MQKRVNAPAPSPLAALSARDILFQHVFSRLISIVIMGKRVECPGASRANET